MRSALSGRLKKVVVLPFNSSFDWSSYNEEREWKQCSDWRWWCLYILTCDLRATHSFFTRVGSACSTKFEFFNFSISNCSFAHFSLTDESSFISFKSVDVDMSLSKIAYLPLSNTIWNKSNASFAAYYKKFKCWVDNWIHLDSNSPFRLGHVRLMNSKQ